MALIAPSPIGNALASLLKCPELSPGDEPSYQVCKDIYTYHPMGGKIVDYPIQLAQSQRRKISVPEGPEDRLVEAFEDEWENIQADRNIANFARVAMIYGISSLAFLTKNDDPSQPLNFSELYKKELYVNVFDPLNTAGSLVLPPIPNSPFFQKPQGFSVQGQAYHQSRSMVLMNEDPIYLSYTSSAFGFSGRSVYQRGLYMLKSYLNSLTTDDLIALKAGVLIAKIKNNSSMGDRMMAMIGAVKRAIVQEAQTGNVIQIGVDENIESLNLQNLDGAYGMARKNIIENLATATGRPAKLLLSESLAEGFGEGTEDAKHIAQFVQGIRYWLQPVYALFDKVVRYRAWNPEFYKAIQADYPDYKKVEYTQAFYRWTNSYEAIWPNLIEEPDSAKIKVADVKLKAAIAIAEVFCPLVPPKERAKVLQFVSENVSAMKELFSTPLVLDWKAIEEYDPKPMEEDGPPKEPPEPKPFAKGDSMVAFSEAVKALEQLPRNRNAS